MHRSALDPPAYNQVEVSIFGSGYGESVIIHLGNGVWMIIDSCRDSSGNPAPLQYLHQIDVNPAEAVAKVVVTHWHDDHISGLSEIFEECVNAEFVCSVAQRDRDFLTFIYTYDEARMMRRTGVKEFRRVLDLLAKRSASVIWAVEMRRIYHRIEPQNTLKATVWALSPSDRAVTLAKQSIAELLPKANTVQRAAVPTDPNFFTIVLFIEVEELRILLGADLIETHHNEVGWSRIVKLKNKEKFNQASIFKVPHHGSETADIEEIWTELLNADPIALVTPFVLGKASLPKCSDILRICQHTDNGYIAAPPRTPRSKRRDNAVERSIREHNIFLRTAIGPMGQVRVRWSSNSVDSLPNIELFGSALPLAQCKCK